jgi:hypothetical protein
MYLHGAVELKPGDKGLHREARRAHELGQNDFPTVRVGIPYPVGFHRDGSVIWEMAGGADGPFYRDTKMQAMIVADDSTITLATTQKALWTYAKTILPANYWTFVGKTVKVTAYGWATTDGTAGNYTPGLGYGSSDAPSAMAAGVARAGVTSATTKAWRAEYHTICQAVGASGNLRGMGEWKADLALQLSTNQPNLLPATQVTNTSADTTVGTNSIVGTLQRSGTGVWTAATSGLIMEALN